MVVVIVIGVLAGFVAPLLGERRAGAELAAAARQVAQAAQLARQEAARTGAEVRLVVGRETPDAWAVEADGEEGPDAPPIAVRRGSVGGGTLPRGVAFAGVEVLPGTDDDPGDQVTFDASGGATPAVIRLVGEQPGGAGGRGGPRGGERAVVVHASGRVEVTDEAAGPPAGRVDLDFE